MRIQVIFWLISFFCLRNLTNFLGVMAKSLVIVESPAKAKTINRYLGKDYVVKSSVGHIRDLPTGGATVDPKARAEEAKRRGLSAQKSAKFIKREGT